MPINLQGLKCTLVISCFAFASNSLIRIDGSTTPKPIDSYDNTGCPLLSFRGLLGLPINVFVSLNLRSTTIPKNLISLPSSNPPFLPIPIGSENTGPPLFPGNTSQSIQILESSLKEVGAQATIPFRTSALVLKFNPTALGYPKVKTDSPANTSTSEPIIL